MIRKSSRDTQSQKTALETRGSQAVTSENTDNKSRQHLLLGIAFALPLMFILTALVVSYLPAATLAPEYNFVYASCSQGRPPYRYNCGNYFKNRYVVENAQLQELVTPDTLDSDNDGVLDSEGNYEARLFLHDTELNQSRELLLPEFRALTLDKKIIAPDGIAMEWEYSHGGNFFPFFDGRSRSGYYLTRGQVRDRLNLVGDSERSYYREDLLFLGWVIEN
jgi:hypothetical protein